MTIAQDPKTSTTSNSLRSEKDFINSILPPELLSKVFEIGADMDDETDDECDDEDDEDDKDEDEGDNRNDEKGYKGDIIIADMDAKDEDRKGVETATDEEEDDFIYDRDHIERLQFATLVSQVCSVWRKVALTTPPIWRRLYVEDETRLDKIAAWLDRSKAVPLDVDVDLMHDELIAPDDFMPLLVEHVSRWRSFDCHTAITEQMPRIMAYLVGKKAPLLEELVLNDQEAEDVFEASYDYPVHSIFAGPASLPNLRQLALWTSPVIWTSHPFANLIQLELCYIAQGTRPSLGQFVALLKSSPKLEKVLISGDIVDASDLRDAFEILGEVPEPVPLNSLRCLTITEFETPSSVNYTLRLFSAPELVELGITDLCFDGEGNPVDFTPTFDLMSTVFSTVEKLELAYVTCANPESLERWLCSLKGLRKLHVIVPRRPVNDPEEDTEERSTGAGQPDPDLAFHFLRAFVPPKQRIKLSLPPLTMSPVCPLLEELTTSGVPDEVLVMFAEARKAQGRPIKCIVHDARDNMSSKCRAQLEELEVELEEYEETNYGVVTDEEDDSFQTQR